MSMMKRNLENCIDELTDDELLKGGYDQDTIDLWRESFGTRSNFEIILRREIGKLKGE